ncbi:MAG: hypothetical protein AAGG51_28750 [Cyanobacteria bacterium P01_G01_bin.54]
MEEFPDANFYKACVPRTWRNSRPQFFNCGNQLDVINSYFRILDLYYQNPADYKLNPDLLFALVDLDSQATPFFEKYKVSDTETLFYDLYENTAIDISKIAQHHLWVTGFIHKEAYLLQPELQDVFDNFERGQSQYNGQPLQLDTVYLDIASAMIPAQGTNALQTHFDTLRQRIQHCPKLDTTTPQKLKSSWLAAFQNSKNPQERRQLIRSLMTVQRVKPQWENIQPPSTWTSKEWQFREQLEVEIGDWYSGQPAIPDNHIACFFRQLQDKVGVS